MKKKTSKNIDKWKYRGVADFVHEIISHKIARKYAKDGDNHKKEITLPIEFRPYMMVGSYNLINFTAGNYMGYKIFFD